MQDEFSNTENEWVEKNNSSTIENFIINKDDLIFNCRQTESEDEYILDCYGDKNTLDDTMYSKIECNRLDIINQMNHNRKIKPGSYSSTDSIRNEIELDQELNLFHLLP